MLWSADARAQVMGSFDGQITGPRVAVPLDAAAALLQTGPFVTGTAAIGGVPPDFAGIYTLTGKGTIRRLKLSGLSSAGALLKWRAKLMPGVLSGPVKIKAPAAKLRGTLTLTLNVATGDGSSCDAVYAGNTTFFVDEVIGKALTACATCHVSNGQADVTRFHVTAADPLATARSMALLVDATNPDTSRILQKPLNAVPHGGGTQIIAGSAEEAILRQWVDLMAQAHCK
jgi:hypothetical protein